MIEVWREIPGVPNYAVTSDARVKSLPRVVKCRGGVRTHKGGEIKPFIAKATGYMQVCMNGKKWSLHRLVAMAWCEGYFPGAWVDHVSGDRSDNRAENLEWVTASENSYRSFKLGRVSPTRGRFSAESNTAKPVASQNISTGEVRIWGAAMDAVRAGFESSQISRCCAGKAKSHRGHTWRMATKEEFTEAHCAAQGVDIWAEQLERKAG